MKYVKEKGRVINWDLPESKSWLDKLTGPGATGAEVFIQFFFPFAFAVTIVTISIVKEWNWNFLQMIMAGLLGMDMLGGIITNATSTGKRWFHREEQSFKKHMNFIFIHIVQLILVMLIFDMGNWQFVLISYTYLLVASFIIGKVHLYLQRPIAMGLGAIGVCLSLYVIPVPIHFEWFLPFFYMKLLISHLLYEESYIDTSSKD